MLKTEWHARVIVMQRWLQLSWRLAPHPLHRRCVCMRCAWRRVHGRFWQSLECASIADLQMSGEESDGGDASFEDGGAFGGGAAFDDSEATCIQESVYHEAEEEEQAEEACDSAEGAQCPIIRDSFMPIAPPRAAGQNPQVRLPGFSAITMGTTGQRSPHNRLKPLYARVFPNVHRMYDGQDKAVAHIAWPFASPPEIWAICNATLLASGQGKQQTMAHFKNHACKTLHDALVKSKQDQVRTFIVFIMHAVTHAQYSHLVAQPPTSWTREMFIAATHDVTFLDILREKMQAYHRTKPITIGKGLFEDATAVHIDTCRLAALMVEPCMFAFLAEKSDPPQGRIASDNEALRAQRLAQQCMQELQRLHNDAGFTPTHKADIAAWCRDIFICIAQPAEERDYAWIASTFRSFVTFLLSLHSSLTCHVQEHQDNDGDVHAQLQRKWQAGQRFQRL